MCGRETVATNSILQIVKSLNLILVMCLNAIYYSNSTEDRILRIKGTINITIICVAS
jgi:hypothetical protein